MSVICYPKDWLDRMAIQNPTIVRSKGVYIGDSITHNGNFIVSCFENGKIAQTDQLIKSAGYAFNRPFSPVIYQDWPLFQKWVAKLHKSADKGTGDTINRMLGLEGVLFKRAISAAGFSCGCDNRQQEYNEKYPYNEEFMASNSIV